MAGPWTGLAWACTRVKCDAGSVAAKTRREAVNNRAHHDHIERFLSSLLTGGSAGAPASPNILLPPERLPAEGTADDLEGCVRVQGGSDCRGLPVP